MQILLDAIHVPKGDRIAKSSLRPHERQKKKKRKKDSALHIIHR